jgi:hypothetical protein
VGVVVVATVLAVAILFRTQRRWDPSRRRSLKEVTLMITIALVAIADIDHPFDGFVHVAPTSFQYALETLSELSAAPAAH